MRQVISCWILVVGFYRAVRLLVGFYRAVRLLVGFYRAVRLLVGFYRAVRLLVAFYRAVNRVGSFLECVWLHNYNLYSTDRWSVSFPKGQQRLCLINVGMLAQCTGVD